LDIEKVKSLREKTGCGLNMCAVAIKYGKGDLNIAIAYLDAKSLTVATPGLSFDERVNAFLRSNLHGR
jgi:translation elongation factor EF-Ts